MKNSLFLILFLTNTLFHSTALVLPSIVLGTKSGIDFNEKEKIDLKNFQEIFYLSTTLKWPKYVEIVHRIDFQIINRFDYYSNIDYLRQINISNYVRLKFNLNKTNFFLNIKPVFYATENLFKIAGSFGAFYRAKQFTFGNNYYIYYSGSKSDFMNYRITLDTTFKTGKKHPLQHNLSFSIHFKDSSLQDNHFPYLEKIKWNYRLKINMKDFQIKYKIPIEEDFDDE